MIYIRYAVLIGLLIKLTYAQADKYTEQINVLTIDQVPYGYLTNDGKATGALFDILNAIMDASTIPYSNSLVPVSRLVWIMQRTPNSCTLAIDSDSLKSEDKIEDIGFTLAAGVIPKKGIKLTSYKDLYGLRLAIPLGMSFDHQLYDDPSINIIHPPKYSNAIKMLASDRVDAVGGAIFILRYLARLQGLKPEMLGSPLIFIEPDVYLICHNELDKKVRDKLKKTVQKLKKDKTIEAILKKYYLLDIR